MLGVLRHFKYIIVDIKCYLAVSICSMLQKDEKFVFSKKILANFMLD